MKFGVIVFLFFIFSFSLLFITIEQNADAIYSTKIKKTQESKIQLLSAKRYTRTRKVYVPERSFLLAKEEINNILLASPIDFEINDSSFLMKSTLLKIAKIVNRVNVDTVLSISAHTDAIGTAQHNLFLSQKRADKLKKYFMAKTNLPLVVAIGYGEAFSLKNRLIEINLKRIK